MIIATMLSALAITFGFNLFALDNFGGFKGEKAMVFICASIAIIFLGAGKYAIESEK